MTTLYYQKILLINTIIAILSSLSNLWSVDTDGTKKLGLFYYCDYDKCMKYKDKDVSFDLKLIYSCLILSNIFMILSIKNSLNKQYLAASILCSLSVSFIWLMSNDVGYTHECLTIKSTCCQCVNKYSFYIYFTTTVISLLIFNNL